MPIYAFECSYGHILERWYRIAERPMALMCPDHLRAARGIISAAGVNVGAVITPADTKNDFTPKGYMGQQRRHYRTEMERQKREVKR